MRGFDENGRIGRFADFGEIGQGFVGYGFPNFEGFVLSWKKSGAGQVSGFLGSKVSAEVFLQGLLARPDDLEGAKLAVEALAFRFAAKGGNAGRGRKGLELAQGPAGKIGVYAIKRGIAAVVEGSGVGAVENKDAGGVGLSGFESGVKRGFAGGVALVGRRAPAQKHQDGFLAFGAGRGVMQSAAESRVFVVQAGSGVEQSRSAGAMAGAAGKEKWRGKRRGFALGNGEFVGEQEL